MATPGIRLRQVAPSPRRVAHQHRVAPRDRSARRARAQRPGASDGAAGVGRRRQPSSATPPATGKPGAADRTPGLPGPHRASDDVVGEQREVGLGMVAGTPEVIGELDEHLSDARGSLLEDRPGQLARLHGHPPEHLPAGDLGTELVGARRDVAPGEVFAVERMRVCAVAVGLHERERRFPWLRLASP